MPDERDCEGCRIENELHLKEITGSDQITNLADSPEQFTKRPENESED